MTDATEPLPFPTVYTVWGPDGATTFEDLDEAKAHAVAIYEETVDDVIAWFNEIQQELGRWAGDPLGEERSVSLVPPWSSESDEDGVTVVASTMRPAGSDV